MSRVKGRPAGLSKSGRPRTLYYTFGNHMHWVDMQWLWGYGVLPGSVEDMLKLCREAGVRGNVNFEGAGYERMAAECPGALSSLREAVASGTVEPVGCSYGQPYGLFHGGESNVRQITYGAGATMRHLGVRPATFWEEEFYMFPQLPQILRRCGYTGASLFFQWTWHTPEVPKEREALIRWEGVDGSGLWALPRNDLNVHQWPEDFDGLLDQGLVNKLATPAVVQWLELMPSRDWMCRSEVLLPRLKALVRDRRFDVRALTACGVISGLLADARQTARRVPVRRYGPDDVWHGMTLGKNADAHPRASGRCERLIVAAEAASTLAGVFGRPYPSWDVYPTWELEEAWRETLTAQHHDNHECEGLCGFIGHASFSRAERLAREVGGRAAWLLARRAGAGDTSGMVLNSLGWTRHATVRVGSRVASVVVPPFGYAILEGQVGARSAPRCSIRRSAGALTMKRGALSVEIDAVTGRLRRVGIGGQRVVGLAGDLLGLRMGVGGRAVNFGKPEIVIESDGRDDVLRVRHRVGREAWVEISLRAASDTEALDVHVTFGGADGDTRGAKPDAGLNAALQMEFGCAGERSRVHADAPYSVHEVRGSGVCKRKYPKGDWMTSPQWFEEVRDPFTALSLVDLESLGGSGVLILHDGSQQWFRDAAGVRCVLTAYDPWDEGRYTADGARGCRFRIVPHAKVLTNAQRVRYAAEHVAIGAADLDAGAVPVGGGTGDLQSLPRIPERFGGLEVVGAPGVLAHALYRDSSRSGEGLKGWAGHRMEASSKGACTHPLVIRLVEWNGESADVTLKLPGPIAMAAKTNLMGEVGKDAAGGVDTGWLKPRACAPPDWARGAKGIGGVRWQSVRFKMRAHEIATVMVDSEPARKQFRDLDAKRKVWAQVHKTK